MTKYLQLNGTSDYLNTPSFTYDKVSFDMIIFAPSSSGYIFDVRPNATIYDYKNSNGSGIDSGLSGIAINGVTGKATTDIPFNTRNTLDFTLSTATTNPTQLFLGNSTAFYLKANVYSIKFYSTGTLVANYDFTKGSTNDQTVNAYNLTVHGTTWGNDVNVSGLTSTKTGDTFANLTWTPLNDSTIANLKVYKNNILIATLASGISTFTDTNLTFSTNYTYKITTVDNSGVESSGTTLSVTTTNVNITTSGLIGYWHAQKGVNGTTWSNIAPSKLGSYNMTLNGSGKHNVDGFNGMSFNGIDDYASLSGFDTTLSSYTIEVVSNLTDSTQWRTPLSSYTDANNYWLFQGNGSTGGYKFDYYSNNVLLFETLNSPNHVLNTLSFDTIVYDGSSYKLYLNGILNSTTNYATPQSMYSNLTIGETNNGSTKVGDRFQGNIMAVRVYNRALSSTEVAQNYNVGSTVGLPDITPPANVQYLNANTTATSVTLNWDNPLDSDFAKARIYKNGVQIAEVTAPTSTYTDSTGLTKGTVYTYKVTSFDTSNNESVGTTITAIPSDSLPSGSYYNFDGVNDYLKTSTLTFDKIVMDAYCDFSNLVTQGDIMALGTVSGLWYKQGTGSFFSLGAVSSTNVDGVNTLNVKNKARQTLTMTLSSPQTTYAVFFGNDNPSYPYSVNGRIYNIKIYNGATLIAHYNPQMGDLKDQTGNGYDATAYNGANFVKAPQYYLSMNGTDNYIQTPTLSFDEVIMDIAPNPKTWGAYIKFNNPTYWNIIFQRNDQGYDTWYTNSTTGFNTFYVDGVSKIWSSITTLKSGIRTMIRTTLVNTYTDSLKFFSGLGGKIYSITILKGGVIQAYYDMSTKSLKDVSGNGNDAVLYGGTTNSNMYLQMNNSRYAYAGGLVNSDSIVTPSLTFDKVILDFMFTPTDPLLSATYIQWGASYSNHFERHSDGFDYFSIPYYSLTKNGISQTSATTFVTAFSRDTYTITSNQGVQTGQIKVLNDGQMGNIYSLKVYNGATLVASYDMSTGTVKDQSGNGNHATLTGGIWTQPFVSGQFTYEPPNSGIHLNMDGVDDYIQTPAITFDEMIMDFSVTGTQPNNTFYYDFLDGINSSMRISANTADTTHGFDFTDIEPIASDNFNRQNSGGFTVSTTTLDNTNSYAGGDTKSWIAYGGATFGTNTSGKAYVITDGSNTNEQFAGIDVGTPNMIVNISPTYSTGFANVIFRAVSNTNYLAVQVTSTGYSLIYYNNGTTTTLASYTSRIPSNGEQITITANGTQISATANTNIVLFSINSTINQTATLCGINSTATASAIFDVFYVSDATKTNNDRNHVYKNEVNVDGSMNFGKVFSDGSRNKLRTTLKSVKSDNVNIFSRKDGTRNMKGKIYSITFKNAGVTVARYDMSTGTVLDQSGNGNHATLNGGTWTDAPNKHTYYLQMDGIDDYVRTPTLTFNKVDLDIFVEHSNGSYHYYLDARTGASNGMVYRDTANYEQWGTGISSVVADGVTGTMGTTFVPDKKRHTLTINMSSVVTDDAMLFAQYQLTSSYGTFVKGRIYGAKFWNGSTLVASYDMTTGTTLDQTGNGYHATLNGGTWVDNTPKLNYCLQMNGKTDALTTPNITFNKVVFDYNLNSIQPATNGYYYLLSDNISEMVRYQGGTSYFDTSGWTSTGLATDSRTTATITLNAITTNQPVGIMNRYTSGSSNYDAKATLYSVKFFNGTTLVAWYDMTKGNVDDQSGNGYHASLIGGTWMPQPKYYLSMNGTSTDYLKTPTLTYTKVEMDFMAKPKASSYYIADGSGSANFVSRTGSNYTTDYTNGYSVLMDGVTTSNNNIWVQDWKRTTMTANFTNGGTQSTNFLTFLGRTAYGEGGSTQGRIYSIKIWNGSTLVAYYDMTQGNVKDQSGNGNDATLYGGTWVNDAHYYLKMSDVGNDTISCGSPMNLTSNIFHITTTIRFSSNMVNATIWKPILANNNYNSSLGYSFNWSANLKRLEWYGTGGGSPTLSYVLGTPSTTSFYTFDIISDGTTTTLKMNGTTIATASTPTPTTATNNLIINGGYNNDGTTTTNRSGFDIKSFYLEMNNKAVINYDMTTGALLDQSNNQTNGILTGGTWEVDSLIGMSGVAQSSSKILWLFDTLDKYNEYQILLYNSSTGSKTLVGRVKYENGVYNSYLESNLNYPYITQKNPAFLQNKLPISTNITIYIVPVIQSQYTSASTNTVSGTTNALPTLNNMSGQKLGLNNLQWLLS